MQKLKIFGMCLPLRAYSMVELDARNPKIKYDKCLKWKDTKVYSFYVSHDVQSELAESITEKPTINVEKIEVEKEKPSLVGKVIKYVPIVGASYFVFWMFSGSSNATEPQIQAAPIPQEIHLPFIEEPQEVATNNTLPSWMTGTVARYESLRVLGQQIKGILPNGAIIDSRHGHFKITVDGNRVVWIEDIPHFPPKHNSFAQPNRYSDEDKETDVTSLGSIF